MIQKPFDQIEKSDIDALITNAVQENKTLEYKEILPGRTDRDKKEFLADVSAFANAAGGDILFGVEEHRDTDGKPTGLLEAANGLSNINTDSIIQRMESIIRDGLAPRINGIQIKAIEGFTGGSVIILRVPNSWASPHMVTFKSISRFYSRTNAGKYPLDVAEIRSAFALSETVGEKIRQFRDGRLAKIVADETPVILKNNPKIVLHVLPIRALDVGHAIDMVALFDYSRDIWPIRSPGRSTRFNFDGLLVTSESTAPEYYSYIQVFRNGAIEMVDAFLLEQREPSLVIPIGALEEELINYLTQVIDNTQSFALSPPIFIMLTMIGVQGYSILEDNRLARNYPIDRDVLLMPDLILDDFQTRSDTVLRPAFDAIWQAAGYVGSQHYNEHGEWVGRRNA